MSVVGGVGIGSDFASVSLVFVISLGGVVGLWRFACGEANALLGCGRSVCVGDGVGSNRSDGMRVVPRIKMLSEEQCRRSVETGDDSVDSLLVRELEYCFIEAIAW